MQKVKNLASDSLEKSEQVCKWGFSIIEKRGLTLGERRIEGGTVWPRGYSLLCEVVGPPPVQVLL